tara:strand:+ start:107 stop:1597 length:1491 start_codon:yes stop_codon:yes gene_type:complete
MKNTPFFWLIICLSITLFAQEKKLPIDTLVITQHKTIIKGQTVNYEAQTGRIPVWNEEGKPIASLFFTYYRRNNLPSNTNRPLVFSFNGGPGAGSLWMHMGYTGPKILKVDDEGYPTQPYGYKSNPYSILDVADIVFVNPVNVGYSRIVEYEGKKESGKTFFGVNQDIKYLAEWISTFISRKNRWDSPKYLIGESYGGVRVMGLSHELQDKQWIYLNGVIMVSPADYQVYPGPVKSAINFPYYTAASWYHKKLPNELQKLDLEEILPQSEEFALNELIPALSKGGFISDIEKNSIADKISYFTGLDKKDILQNNINLSTSFFWKELLRDEGKTIGRLDSRYKGIDRQDSGNRVDYNAEMSAWDHAFTPAINHYLQNELKFKSDVKYNTWGRYHHSVRPWNRENVRVRDNLRQAMAENPFLKVFIQSGFYDGATTYFSAKYTMWQIDPSGKFKDRFFFKGYRSGHMMYLRKEDLVKANDDLREFIKNTTTNGKPAKY